MSTPQTKKSRAVVISDVHIGTNVPTNWYQRSVHEHSLVAALDWVVDNAASIRELVILGDLVDFWTYVPSQKPPTISEIIAANPAVLGPKGALSRVVAALPGGVSLLTGNHDGTLTAADVATLSAAVGGPIQLVDPVYVVQGQSGKRTVFTHGHHWTMFNAPDPTTRLAPLPIGHFVTRMLAYKVAGELKAGQTCADLSAWGYGLNLSKGIAQVVNALSAPGLVNLALGGFLQVFLDNTGFPADTPVVLPGGQTCTVNDAKTNYASLLDNWLKAWGPIDAARAAMADYSGGSYLGWFAQKLALEHNADVVVMGHTHEPISGSIGAPTVQYVNSGYECAAKPDVAAGTAAFTFTVIDLEQPAFKFPAFPQLGPVMRAQLKRVAEPTLVPGQPLAITDFSAKFTPVVEGRDFSCYISITNNTGKPLTRGPLATPKEGRWVVPPPTTIADGDTAQMWLQDPPDPTVGSAALVTYGNMPFGFGCPAVADNFAASPGLDFVARSGTAGWQAKGVVPPRDHPLAVRFTVTAADAKLPSIFPFGKGGAKATAS